MDKVDTLISINECHSAKERRAFESVPEVLHRGTPAFVPAFPFSIAKLLSPRSVFHRLHGTIRPFIACRGGRPVGRIAAIINRSHNEHHRDRVGFSVFLIVRTMPKPLICFFPRSGKFYTQRGWSPSEAPTIRPSITNATYYWSASTSLQH